MGKDLVEIVKESGIVGAGGAGFPTHVKLNAKAQYIIVNGAECEPLLRVDQQLLATKTKEILSALEIIIGNIKAKKGIIALKSKYKEAINALKKSVIDSPYIEIFELDNFYPAGDEQVTVYEVLNRIVPEGGIPLNVDVIVINVETLLNIYKAFQGKAVVEKYVTVTGEVKNPKTIKVPIGVTIKEAIDLAGGATISDFKVIDGGPMMGKIIEDINEPITKTTKGLIVIPKNHSLLVSKKMNIDTMLKKAKTACMHCSLCTEVCPRNLLGHNLYPDKLMRVASYNSTCEKDVSITQAFLCCECRLCEYACVMDLKPWKLNQFLKGKMGEAGIKNPHHKQPQRVHPFRRFRRYPVNKLIAKLGLRKYDIKIPFEEKQMEFKRVTIFLKQHIGAESVPVVKKGDRVNCGDLVADIPNGKLGAKIHASIDGIVEYIDEEKIIINK